jgi:hypothetical protein
VIEMNNKRGQAAMEFLMTYGWAILAAVIAIGVLAYFGVFSPGKYMPESCVINQPFGCEESLVNTTGVTLVIRNGLGDVANITGVAIVGCTAYNTNFAINDSGVSVPISLACGGLSSGGKFKGDITITYTKTGGTLAQTATGSITKKVA